MNTASEIDPLNDLKSKIDQFSWNIFEEISCSKSENLICSPLSVHVVLEMLSHGANDETEEEIRCALYTEDGGDRGYKIVSELLNNVKDVEMNIAHTIFTTAKNPRKQRFLDSTLKTFYSTPELVDFSEPVAAADAINKWCEDQTKGRIKELFSSDAFTENTGVVLVSAIYFKGQWNEPFEPELTKDLPFYTDKTNFENVSMMQKKGKLSFGCSDILEADLIEIPYKGNDFSMIIILPYEFNGLKNIQRHLHPIYIFNFMENPSFKRGAKLPDPEEEGYTSDEVNLQLPKFKVESEIDLKSVLQNLGIKKSFERTANFSELSDSAMKVDKVLQKAFIEVNEEGSGDAAATGISINQPSMPLGAPTPFFVNRPFCFAIVHRPSKMVLIMGTVKMPNYPKEN